MTNSVLAPPWSLPNEPFSAGAAAHVSVLRPPAPELKRGHDCCARRQAAALQVGQEGFERGIDGRQIGRLSPRLALMRIEVEWDWHVDDAQPRLCGEQLGAERERTSEVGRRITAGWIAPA